MKKFTFIFFACCLFYGVQAQDISIGFKAGLNFSKFSGPSEQINSNDVGKYDLKNGFHIGADFDVRFTDQFGARAGLIYYQRGTDFNFDGQSYWMFYPETTDKIVGLGNRNMILSVTNNYLQLPLTAYARFGRIEVSAGAGVAVLLESKGAGEITFTGQTPAGSNIAPFTTVLELDYKNDAFKSFLGEKEVRIIDGHSASLPEVIGAYYEAFDNGETAFNKFDAFLHAGVAFYLNKGMSLGLGLNYGLMDVTNDLQDISLTTLDQNLEFIEQKDVDTNLSIEASIGFRF